MSHLIPTPIVNKNGVSTTVYKAVENPASTAPRNIPSPTVASVEVPAPTKVMKFLQATFDDPFTTVPSDISPAYIQRTLEGYPQETQEYMSEVFLNHPEDSYLDRMVISMLDKRHSPEIIEDALFVYDSLPDSWDAITIESDWTGRGFDVDNYLIQVINGARGYGVEVYSFGTEDKSLRHYDESTQQQALALIALAYEMSVEDSLREGLGSSDTSIYISDPSTVKHIIDYPYLVEEVRDAMLEHGRTSWGAIDAIQNAPSVPLRDGTL